MKPDLINLILLLTISSFFYYWLRRLSKWVRVLSKTIIEVSDQVDSLQATEASRSYFAAKMALEHLRAIDKPTAENYAAINEAEQHMAELEKKYKINIKNL